MLVDTCEALLNALREGEHDSELAALYALDGNQASLDAARDRKSQAKRS